MDLLGYLLLGPKTKEILATFESYKDSTTQQHKDICLGWQVPFELVSLLKQLKCLKNIALLLLTNTVFFLVLFVLGICAMNEIFFVFIIFLKNVLLMLTYVVFICYNVLS